MPEPIEDQVERLTQLLTGVDQLVTLLRERPVDHLIQVVADLQASFFVIDIERELRGEEVSANQVSREIQMIEQSLRVAEAKLAREWNRGDTLHYGLAVADIMRRLYSTGNAYDTARGCVLMIWQDPEEYLATVQARVG